MMKHIWIWAACLAASPLLSETIGNVEFQFPPSNYEWKLLVDDSSCANVLFADDDDDDFEASPSTFQWGSPSHNDDSFYDDEDDFDFDAPQFKIFTHREGDALEIFVAMHDSNPDQDEEEELDTLEIIQKELDETINKFLPNHKMILHSLTDNGDEGFADWELNDGFQDVMHGFMRYLKIKENGIVQSTTMLSYLTTAVRTEYNRMLWTDVLNQAKLSD